MVKYCPKCGYPNPDEAMYCVRCGTPLATVQQPQSPPQQPPYQQPAQPPSYPQQPMYPPPQQPPYQQYPYPQPYPKRRKFPIKAVIGAVIAVVVVLVVVFVVLPMFTKPSYPVSASDLQSIYGGTWTVLNNRSGTITFSSSSETISYFNGTTKTLPLISNNITFFDFGPQPTSYFSSVIVVVMDYKTSSGSGLVGETVYFIKSGTPLYTCLQYIEANNISLFFPGFNHGVASNGVIYSWGFHVVVLLDKSNGEVVVLYSLPYVNSAIASQLASYL
ncbi:zinc ribbon domain-containing protein [Sulfolobaceae archaeon RB850M]